MRGSTASKIKALDKPAQPCHTPSTPSEEKMEDNRDEQTPSGPVGQAPAGERTSPGLDRRKFLLAQGGPTASDNLLHNLRDLRNQSCVLPNFCGAATAYTPDRATLLTGLYSQQTYIFNTLENSGEPELIPYTGPIPPDPTSVGFPTIGNVLSQKLPIGTTGNTSQGYDTVWIGKWHLSAIGTEPNNTCTSTPCRT